MNLMAENMKGTRFAHYTDEVFQKHTYGSENVTQGLLSCDNAGIGWMIRCGIPGIVIINI